MAHITVTTRVLQYSNYDLSEEQYQLYKTNPDLFWETYYNEWASDTYLVNEDILSEDVGVCE